jgi:hypothetical protein
MDSSRSSASPCGATSPGARRPPGDLQRHGRRAVNATTEKEEEGTVRSTEKEHIKRRQVPWSNARSPGIPVTLGIIVTEPRPALTNSRNRDSLFSARIDIVEELIMLGRIRSSITGIIIAWCAIIDVDARQRGINAFARGANVSCAHRRGGQERNDDR